MNTLEAGHDFDELPDSYVIRRGVCGWLAYHICECSDERRENRTGALDA